MEEKIMHSATFSKHSLPPEVKKVMVIEVGERFSKNNIKLFFEIAKEVNAISLENEGDGERKYFWVVYPNNTKAAIASTKKRLRKDLKEAAWNN